LTAPAWLWIAATVWAAFAQTIRNAAQRHLTAELGTLGATLVRFLYGLPYALLWLYFVHQYFSLPFPSLNARFFGWVLLGALSQTAATALLLRVMQERNFALGVAYSKTEILQVAVFGLAFLGDPLGWATIAAVLFGTAGVVLIAPPKGTAFSKRTALLGLASGAGFALSAVGYRGAALALEGTPFLMAAACTLVWAQFLSTLALGGWLLARERAVLGRVLGAWKLSQIAGFMGAAASAGWFTAFALQTAAHVRTLGLLELVFSYLVSLRFFREKLSRHELLGMALLAVGVVLVTLPQADPRPKKPAASTTAATPAQQARERHDRATLMMRDGQLDAALSEIDKAIALQPNQPELHVLRGTLWYLKLDEHNALRAFEAAIKLGSRDATAYNSAAWILSTSKDHSVRDGKRALELARQACELTAWQEPSFIDTLAAAHAEVGAFDEAVREQQRALDFPQFSFRNGPGARKRLELYKAGQPYRGAPMEE
jgi:drug/metabolite transporter (DMT)-like permease